MQVSREFSPDVAQVLQVIDEKILKDLLQDKIFVKGHQNQISKQQLKKTFDFLKSSNPFQDIKNPVEWQREKNEQTGNN